MLTLLKLHFVEIIKLNLRCCTLDGQKCKNSNTWIESHAVKMLFNLTCWNCHHFYTYHNSCYRLEPRALHGTRHQNTSAQPWLVGTLDNVRISAGAGVSIINICTVHYEIHENVLVYHEKYFSCNNNIRHETWPAHNKNTRHRQSLFWQINVLYCSSFQNKTLEFKMMADPK